eukprot:3428779-Rhodomonas_salina.2
MFHRRIETLRFCSKGSARLEPSQERRVQRGRACAAHGVHTAMIRSTCMHVSRRCFWIIGDTTVLSVSAEAEACFCPRSNRRLFCARSNRRLIPIACNEALNSLVPSMSRMRAACRILSLPDTTWTRLVPLSGC